MGDLFAAQIRNNNLKVYLWMTILTVIIGVLGSAISCYSNWKAMISPVGLLIYAIGIYLAYKFCKPRKI